MRFKVDPKLGVHDKYMDLVKEIERLEAREDEARKLLCAASDLLAGVSEDRMDMLICARRAMAIVGRVGKEVEVSEILDYIWDRTAKGDQEVAEEAIRTGVTPKMPRIPRS